MRPSFVVSLRKDVRATEDPNGDIRLEWPGGRITVREPGPGLGASILALADGGATEETLGDLAAREAHVRDVARLYHYLARWGQLGLLRYVAAAGTEELAAIEPMSPAFTFQPRETLPGHRYVLSRFACCRREGGRLVLESPLACGRVVFWDPAGPALLAGLATPSTPDDLGGTEKTRALLDLLLTAGMLESVGESGRTEEDENIALRQWEFHDLLFHSRSRAGRTDGPYGGVYSYRNEIPPLPALKSSMSADTIALDRPDIAALSRRDLPFTGVLEERRSIREYGDQPVTRAQLDAFLYRAARVRALVPPGHWQYEGSNRPYPGGGACYELEIYAAVNRCDGLAPGLYHYDPLGHALARLRGLDTLVQDLLAESAWVTAPHPLQIVFGITARFQRLAWKYRGMAYAVMLKDVGALYQTMYLVAAAMDLAPCAAGGGSADLLAQAIGTEYHVESAVGEFLLGSRRSAELPRDESR